MTIDLNVDLAEGFPYDEELMAHATSVNVCLGAHAGSPALAWKTIAHARNLGLQVGLHPGYPDIPSMGRRSPRDEDRSPWMESVCSQIREFGKAGQYVKLHGALYNEVAQGTSVPEPLREALNTFGKPILGLPVEPYRALARAAGIRLWREGFADRGYHSNGTLLARGEPGAFLSDPADSAANALRLVSSVDSLCIHGDADGCVSRLAEVRRTLERNGITVAAIDS